MRLIRLNNTISSFGLMFVFCGLIFPGYVASAPPACDNAIDIGDKEDQLLTKTLSYDPPDDNVDCYQFTVSSGAGLTQLSVDLQYEVIDEKNDELILKLFSSTSVSVLKETTIGGGDFTGDQGAETLFWESTDGLEAGETYYIRIDNDTTIPDGYEYKVKWNDDDDTANPTITEGSESPEDEALVPVQPGGLGQTLQVAVENTTTCHIYYKDEDNAEFTDSGELIVVDDGTGGLYCQVTVQYGDSMDNNGANYWYVQAGATRYPSTGTLSFTVQSLPGISNPSPEDGASVPVKGSSQLLQVAVTNAETCTIYYGTDENNITASEAGTLADDLCKVTVPYDGVHMINNGMNYWYVEAESAVTSPPIRYPSTDTLSFTVSITQDKKPIIAPMLLLLLKGDSEEPPSTTSGKAMPWLMLLL